MKKWDELSMADKAKYIELGVASGITNLSIIRAVYNKYKSGGKIHVIYPDGKISRNTYRIGNAVRLNGENFYRRINSDGTLTKISRGENGSYDYKDPKLKFSKEFKVKAKDTVHNNIEQIVRDFQSDYNSRYYNVPLPFNPKDKVTITDIEGLNGIVFSRNQLDSITKYSASPIDEAIALGIQESTFLNPVYPEGQYHQDSNDKYNGIASAANLYTPDPILNPFYDLVAEAAKTAKIGKRKSQYIHGDKIQGEYIGDYYGYGNKAKEKYKDKLISGLQYSINQSKKNPERINLITQLTSLFHKNPEKYNPGNEDYVPSVKRYQKLIKESPQFQREINDSKKRMNK